MVPTLVLLAATFASICGERVKVCDEIGVRPYARINNKFGNQLLNVLSTDAGNLFFSPSSLSSLLSAVYYGARGETANNLTEFGYLSLQYENASLVTPRLSYCLELLHNLKNTTGEFNLERANAMLIQKDFPIHKQYKYNLSKTFGALAEEVDFVGHRDKVVEWVNSWVREKTHNKIFKLVDDLDESTRLLLLSAIYFKGTWRTKFDESNTKQRPFYNNGNRSPTSVPTMKMHAKLPFLYDYANRYRALQIPYNGNDTSMLVLLPFEKDGLDKLQKTITYDTILELLDSLQETEVTVSLPKFRIEYSRKMRNDLENIGFRGLFSPDADFSGISGRQSLCVSNVIHKAVIEVNEDGSEAAAPSGGIGFIRKTSKDPRNEFVADHPFLFYIVDNRSGSNLFVGRVKEI
uniref:Putative Protease inhibitor n=1 Tax=Megacormus gertschi TaxID=1843536 RepID=A0A224XFJ9_9SCOR